jgi:Ca-activated chloride channel family protein
MPRPRGLAAEENAMDKRTRTKMIAKMCTALAVVALIAQPVWAEQVKLDVAIGTPVMLAGQKQTAYLRVAVEGFELDDPADRSPVNVAIVLDKSGSMQGEKIARAKDAAIMAIDRLQRDDIVSVIAYDSTVHVLVPATKVSNREEIYAAIRRLEAGGSTALFAGVSKGACEVRKFIAKNRVNRVILLSDGIANVGPSSPGDLAELGSSLIRGGMSVSTIGLGMGYNEDLMTQLANASDGNHMFAENATDLARAFEREFGDVLAVVAQEVTVTVRCPKGIRPVRVLGHDADIVGQTVTVPLNQLYSEHMKYVVLEVELPPARVNRKMKVASVDVSYSNMLTKTTDRLASSVSVVGTDSPGAVEENTNRNVMIAVSQQIGLANNLWAMQLRDEGKIEEARRLLGGNSEVLYEAAKKYKSQALQDYAESNQFDLRNLDEKNWKRQRKLMQEQQQAITFNHIPGGGNVLYMDGRVAFERFPESSGNAASNDSNN